MNDANGRMMILKMIEDGKINAEEASKLLISDTNNDLLPVKDLKRGNQKWFRVRVTDTATGKNKAIVSLPLALMEWGLQVGSQFATDLGNVNLSDLSDILNQGLEGKIIDVLDEEDGEHVEIFIE